MNPVQKALWFVESNLRGPITLDDAARHARVSPFHLTRAFAAITGRPLMRYVRARRLSEAARALAGGAPDILALALEFGYGSHEAFTRAFRDQFKLTPEQARDDGAISRIGLTGPILLDSLPCGEPGELQIETWPALLIAGASEHYDCEGPAGIAAQWARTAPLDSVANRVGGTAYGVAYNHDDDGGFDYLCGVEVAEGAKLRAGFSTLRIPARTYAVFYQREHIASIRQAIAAIWSKWMPRWGREVADAPIVERYGAGFSAETGFGGFEICIPLKS